MGRPTNGPEILYICESPNMKRAVWTANPRRMSKASKETQKLAKDIMDRRMPAAVSSPKLHGGVSSILSARANSSQHHTFALVEHHFRPVRS